MSDSNSLRLGSEQRARLWRQLVSVIEQHWATVDSGRVAPILDPDSTRDQLDALDLSKGLDPEEAIDFVVRGLGDQQVHTAHRRYFGLYNPSPGTMGVAGDAIVAAFNPQLAAWSHSPFAAEVEAYLIREIGTRFGFAPGDTDGVFASGGAEANHTAVLTALVRAVPDYRAKGVDPGRSKPTMYTTGEAHDSLRKAASLSGIGLNAVKVVPSDTDLRMDASALRTIIADDRANGFLPFLVVGTAGTTSAGVIDPLGEIADVAAEANIWYHVDAAWGGAAALSTSAKSMLGGIALADSITFDAHKWLSVPMGAGMFITRHRHALTNTFGTENVYMPRDAAGLDIVDPFSHSIQWSRRFTGLKLFLTLAVAGWSGYEQLVDREIALGKTLRSILADRGWTIANCSELPVVCVADQESDPFDRGAVDRIVAHAVGSGKVWVSSAVLSDGRACVRACITNFETDESDLVALADALDDARRDVRGSARSRLDKRDHK